MLKARGHWTLPAGLIAGVLAAHQFPILPPCWLLLAALPAALYLLPGQATRALAIMVLACCWTLWQFGQRLDDRLDASLNGSVMTVEGVVTGRPERHREYSRFRFAHVPVSGQHILPGVLLVYW